MPKEKKTLLDFWEDQMRQSHTSSNYFFRKSPSHYHMMLLVMSAYQNKEKLCVEELKTKLFKTSIIISDKTQELIKDKPFLSRKLDRVSVVGRNEPMDIFEIFDYEEESIKEAKLKSRQKFENSVEIYEKGNWSDALKGFEQCIQSFPDDPATKIYLNRCQIMINNPDAATSWDGITYLTKK